MTNAKPPKRRRRGTPTEERILEELVEAGMVWIAHVEMGVPLLRIGVPDDRTEGDEALLRALRRAFRAGRELERLYPASPEEPEGDVAGKPE